MVELLRVEGITRSFGDRQILRGIDLTVDRGEVLGLVGQNGVGKSTLASIISGRIQADAGQLTLRGEPLVATSPQEARQAGVGIIEQRFRLDGNLRVTEALFRHTTRRDEPYPELRRAAQLLLIDVGIAIDPDARLSELSHSDLGLVETVRLLADQRDLTIVDEVAGTFNAREVEELRYIVRRLTDAGQGVIYITHRLPEALDMCDRVAVMREGRIAAVFRSAWATPEELSEAMFGHQVAIETKERHITDEIVLRVRDLAGGDGACHSFDLRRGEVLAFAGARDVGVGDIIGALTGDRCRPAGLLEINGQPVTIERPRDAVQLKIAYLAAGDDELGLSAEESLARSLLTGGVSEGADFDAEVSAVLEILEAMNLAAHNAGKLLAKLPGAVRRPGAVAAAPGPGCAGRADPGVERADPGSIWRPAKR